MLWLVVFVDWFYDVGILVVVFGVKLDIIFSEEMLVGGY